MGDFASIFIDSVVCFTIQLLLLPLLFLLFLLQNLAFGKSNQSPAVPDECALLIYCITFWSIYVYSSGVVIFWTFSVHK